MNIIKLIRKIKTDLFWKKVNAYPNYLRKKGMTIGERCKILNSYIDPGHCYLISLGDDVTITNATLLAHDASPQIFVGKTRVGKIKIGSRVFIGWGSIILPNVTIGDDVIIGSGSIVTKDIPSNSVVTGNPAKVICSLTDFKKKHEQYLKTKPVYNNYGVKKTPEEVEKMKMELENTFGYDV